MRSDNTAADDDNLGRLDTRHAANKGSGAAMRLFKRLCTGDHRKTSGDLGHRHQQRKASLCVHDGLIGNAGRTGLDQISGLVRIRSQMQICEENVVRTQHGPLDRLGLLDLHDHLRGVEDFLCRAEDSGTCGLVVGITRADTDPSIGLNEHFVPVSDHFVNTVRRQSDPVFMVLDFLRHTNAHNHVSSGSVIDCFQVYVFCGRMCLRSHDANAGVEQFYCANLEIYRFFCEHGESLTQYVRCSKMKLDRLDRKILDVLQKDGRIANADLADVVGLSASACLRRVRALEEAGVIENYVALLDQRKLGRRMDVFVEISLTGQSKETLESFERAVARSDEIMECFLMAGDADYILRLTAADPIDFERIHRDHLSQLPGVLRMKSSFAIRPIVKRTAIPLEAEV